MSIAIHESQPVLRAGAPLGEGAGVVIMVHGRGATPHDILSIAEHLDRPDVTYLAPAAANNTWYPYSFLTDITKNEPYLTSALARLEGLIAEAVSKGTPVRRIALLGFSQGACLSLEFAVRHPQRYGAVIGFSGGLIGPPGTAWNRSGAFDRAPVFLGCSDIDPHIPQGRVLESAEVFTSMGADVTTRIYPGMGHLVNDDEIAAARAMLARISDT